MDFKSHHVPMTDWVQEQIPPVSLETATLTNKFDLLTLADHLKMSLANNTETFVFNIAEPKDENSVTYLGALRLMIYLSNAGHSPDQIYALFSYWKKFFPLVFIQLVLGEDGGLTSVSDLEFSAVGISPILNPTSPSPGEQRMAPSLSITSTPAVRALLEQAGLYQLHVHARTTAFSLILQAHDNLLSYDEMEKQLFLHGFRVSEKFYMHIYFSRTRWGTPLESEQYTWHF